ncbi:OB-fold protein [Flavobacterium muglaense]|uniref:tRNA_anti-like n=1 Tax=Flavobacterium muglaense TaxID=2764716 RepID=A0A923SEN9_9FLAO|nr:hypothetical protein [Flavobacterium muglaense]MBC5837314.1 hypothetical protein [Flavobacterium muglaense]MBC5843762.1 hypothetical protein [Flavobacterium muglaense]
MKKLKRIIIAITILLLIGLSTYYYIMHAGARDLSAEESAYTVTAKDITIEFNTNIDDSNKKYLEKPIAITGIVTALTPTQITIDKTVICNLKNPQTNIEIDQLISLKGRVIGYDDLMEEVKIDQCIIIKKSL